MDKHLHNALGFKMVGIQVSFMVELPSVDSNVHLQKLNTMQTGVYTTANQIAVLDIGRPIYHTIDGFGDSIDFSTKQNESSLMSGDPDTEDQKLQIDTMLNIKEHLCTTNAGLTICQKDFTGIDNGLCAEADCTILSIRTNQA